MELWDLGTGDRIVLQPGSRAEVTAQTQDGRWVPVRLLDGPDGAPRTPDLVSAGEILRREP